MRKRGDRLGCLVARNGIESVPRALHRYTLLLETLRLTSQVFVAEIYGKYLVDN